MAAKKNSLVANINRRKRAGTSRPRSGSTIASEAYQDMQAGWPRRKTAKKKAVGKKSKRAAGKKSKRAAGEKSKRAAGKKSKRAAGKKSKRAAGKKSKRAAGKKSKR